MSQPVVTTKILDPVDLVGLDAVVAAATSEEVSPVIGPMYGTVMARLEAAGVALAGPGIAFYTPVPEESEEAVRVHAAVLVDVATVPGLQAYRAPGGQFATVIHRGPMTRIDVAYQTLWRWLGEQGHTATGVAREVYLEMGDDEEDWVTEVSVQFGA